MKLMQYLKRIAIILIPVLLSGCSAMLNQPMSTKPPRLGLLTETQKRLNELPPPKEKITAAVYNFRDKTGQYKLTETGGSWSTVITQGSTSILIKALEESGWFVPIEREGLGNLLNERKIIRSSRAFYDQDNAALPPLLFAGIMLEGGIISYDYNILTGGVGLRYFGTGASGQYRQDRVTVYLRAVSTQSGKILKTVYSSKTVLSQKLDGGIFRYVKFKRLLEAETGFTYNEPTEIAVKEAIEKAVESLIIEGVFDNLWELQNSEDINSQIIQNYVTDKALNENMDVFGVQKVTRFERFGVTVGSEVTYYAGDYVGSILKPAFNVQFGYNINSNWNVNAEISKDYLATNDYFKTNFNTSSLGVKYRFTPTYDYTMFFRTGVGIMTRGANTQLNVEYSDELDYYTFSTSELGIEFLLGERKRIGLQFSGKLNYIFSDYLDGIEQGQFNDFYWKGSMGVSYYF